MRQAIETRYAGPTNSNGARLIVRSQAGRKIVPWDHALDVADNHLAAARHYAFGMGWLEKNTLRGGGNAKGDGYCFVLVSLTEYPED